MALCRRGHDSARISEPPREPAPSPRHQPRTPWSLRNVRVEIRAERSPAAPPAPRTESGKCRSLVTTQEFTPSRRNNEAKQENCSGVHRHAVHSTRSPARPPLVYGNSGQHQAANPLYPRHTETPRPGRSSPPRTHTGSTQSSRGPNPGHVSATCVLSLRSRLCALPAPRRDHSLPSRGFALWQLEIVEPHRWPNVGELLSSNSKCSVSRTEGPREARASPPALARDRDSDLHTRLLLTRSLSLQHRLCTAHKSRQTSFSFPESVGYIPCPCIRTATTKTHRLHGS